MFSSLPVYIVLALLTSSEEASAAELGADRNLSFAKLKPVEAQAEFRLAKNILGFRDFPEYLGSDPDHAFIRQRNRSAATRPTKRCPGLLLRESRAWSRTMGMTVPTGICSCARRGDAKAQMAPSRKPEKV